MRPFSALATFAWQKIDTKIVDFTVDLIARIIYSTGQNARKMQSGNLSDMPGVDDCRYDRFTYTWAFYRPMV